MDIREISELQLLRISHGAHELSHMIDSWSKTSTSGFESIQMANELLKSSLELQESLQMLSRLQEISRRMSRKNVRERGIEEDEEESFFMAMSSKSYNKLQEPRLSVGDCSTNSVEELKQVIRDRLCKQNLLTLKSDNGNAISNTSLKFTGRKINLSSQTIKMKAPSLIARLMGLEQFPLGSKDHQKIKQGEEIKEQPEQKSLEKVIETMKFKGILKNDHSQRYRAQPDVHGINIDQGDEDLPIVILKSVNLSPWDREEIKLDSEKISEREKTTLAKLLLEEKAFDHSYLPVKSNLKYNTEPIQNSQKEKNLNMETRRIVDRKSSVIQGKKFAELKEVKAIGAPVNTTSVELTKSEKRKLTEKISVKTYKSIKQNNKDNYSTKSMALKSNCRKKESREKSVRKFITETETNDQKFKDGKLRSSGTETRALPISNSILITDGLQKEEKKEKIIFVNKDEIRKDHKIVCEMMPRTNHARRNSRLIEQSIKISINETSTNTANKSHHLFKHKLLNSQSFLEYVHDHLGIDVHIPIHFQAKNSEDLRVGGEQLLLDCAKELMALKSHEGKLLISQMLQPHQRKRSSFLSFKNLLEEISNEIKELASYSENGDGTITKDSLYFILEKDLNATWDVGRNNWVGLEEADQVVVEVEKQIISRLIMEVAMDLVAFE